MARGGKWIGLVMALTGAVFVTGCKSSGSGKPGGAEGATAAPAEAPEVVDDGTKLVVFAYPSVGPKLLCLKDDATSCDEREVHRAEATPAQAAKLWGWLASGANFGGDPAKCWEPRHTIAMVRDGKLVGRVDLCLACNHMKIASEDAKLAGRAGKGSGDDSYGAFTEGGVKRFEALVAELKLPADLE